MTVALSTEVAGSPGMRGVPSSSSAAEKMALIVPGFHAEMSEGNPTAAPGGPSDMQWKAMLSSAGIGGEASRAPFGEGTILRPAQSGWNAKGANRTPVVLPGVGQSTTVVPIPNASGTAISANSEMQVSILQRLSPTAAQPDTGVAHGVALRSAHPSSVKHARQDRKSKKSAPAAGAFPVNLPSLVPILGAMSAPAPAEASPLLTPTRSLVNKASPSTASVVGEQAAHSVASALAPPQSSALAHGSIPLLQEGSIDPSNPPAVAARVTGWEFPEVPRGAQETNLVDAATAPVEPGQSPQLLQTAVAFHSANMRADQATQKGADALTQAYSPVPVDRSSVQVTAAESNPTRPGGALSVAPSAAQAGLPVSPYTHGSQTVRSNARTKDIIHAATVGPPTGTLPAVPIAHATAATTGVAVAPSAGGSATAPLSGYHADGSPLSPPTVQTSFIAMDSAPTGDGPAWVRASAHHAEAGFLDSSLGWVSVRAEASAGGIHAALVGAGTVAAQSLSGHLAGLNAYLQEHQMPVQSLHVTQQGNGWTGAGSGGGLEQGGQGQNTAGDHSSSSGSPRVDPVQPRAASPPATGVAHGALHNDAEANGTGAPGRRLSVIA